VSVHTASNNHTVAQRWFQTLADELTVEQAQARVVHFARVCSDARLRTTAGGRSSVVAMTKTEPLF
jgi:hypothetical protein